MARPRAIAHSRPHLSPRASFLSLSSFVSPLHPLGLGYWGRCDPRSFLYFYVVTDGGPASHRVRLWQGGLRPRIAVFVPLLLFTGTSIPRVRLPGHPEDRKRPWPLRVSRGDGNGGPLRPLALPSFVARFAPLRCTSDAVTLTFVSLCFLYSDSPLSSRPQPLGRVGDVTPCEDTREDFGLSV